MLSADLSLYMYMTRHDMMIMILLQVKMSRTFKSIQHRKITDTLQVCLLQDCKYCAIHISVVYLRFCFGDGRGLNWASDYIKPN